MSMESFITTIASFFLRIFIYMLNYIKKFVVSLIKFGRKKVKGIRFFLTKVLTTNELTALITFVVFFALTDRYASKKVKYPKTKAPNLLWRMAVPLLYLPLWLQFVYPWFIIFVGYVPSLFYTFGSEFVDGAADLYSFRRDVELFFGDRLPFISIYQMFLYFSVRPIVALIPKRFFRLPMYMKYHVINISLLILVSEIVYQGFSAITDFALKRGLADLEGLSLSWTILLFLTIGRSTWDALRGKSFTKTFLDIPIRTHLGFNCLYDDEQWSDYGVDEVLNKDD